MGQRNIRVTAERRKSPDLDTFVAALLALAMERLREERSADADRGVEPPPDET